MSALDKPKGRRLHYAWVILVVGTLVVFGSLGLARFGYTMLLPAMQAELKLDNTHTGGLATANLAGYLVLAVAGGALAARFGPRAVITAGLALAAAAMLLTAVAAGFADAAAYRAMAGVGSGASNVPVMGLMAAWFARRRRGLAAGIAVSGSSVALILLGALVPGVMEARGADGWRVCWLGFGAVTAVVAALALIALRNRPSDAGLRPLGAANGDSPPPAAGRGGLHWGRVYRSAVVWHVGAIYVAFGFSYIIYLTFFTKYLIAECDYTPAGAGRLFMLMGWLSLLCGLVWGWVSDAIGRKGALVIVYLIQAACFGLFALGRAPWCLTLSAILFGLTAWSIPAIVAATCGDLLGGRLAPAGLGFVTLFLGIGQVAGPAVAGAVADATNSLAPAMGLAAAVAALGALGAGLLRHDHLKQGEAHTE